MSGEQCQQQIDAAAAADNFTQCFRTFQVGLSEQAVEVARRLCRWKDVCLLRKVCTPQYSPGYLSLPFSLSVLPLQSPCRCPSACLPPLFNLPASTAQSSCLCPSGMVSQPMSVLVVACSFMHTQDSDTEPLFLTLPWLLQNTKFVQM